MPLVVPGINNTSESSNPAESWMMKLAGKKLGDSHDETSFKQSDLPKDVQIVKPGDAKTSSAEKKLNVHVDEEGLVKNVTYE